jgi:hypothetical protein
MLRGNEEGRTVLPASYFLQVCAECAALVDTRARQDLEQPILEEGTPTCMGRDKLAERASRHHGQACIRRDHASGTNLHAWVCPAHYQGRQ